MLLPCQVGLVDLKWSSGMVLMMYDGLCFNAILGQNGLSKSIPSVQKVKNEVFENFSSFANEIVKKEQIQNFYRLIINYLSPASS